MVGLGRITVRLSDTTAGRLAMQALCQLRFQPIDHIKYGRSLHDVTEPLWSSVGAFWPSPSWQCLTPSNLQLIQKRAKRWNVGGGCEHVCFCCKVGHFKVGVYGMDSLDDLIWSQPQVATQGTAVFGTSALVSFSALEVATCNTFFTWIFM